MKRTCFFSSAILATLLISHATFAGDANFSMNLSFNTPGDSSSGGTWTIVGKVDDYGLAGASLCLTPAAEFSSFLAPAEYEVQVYADFGTVINFVIGDDIQGEPLWGAGVIGSSWPSNYPTEPDLVLYGGYPDLGAFAGGIALVTGTFAPGTVPDWTNHPGAGGDPSDANLYTAGGGTVNADTYLTIRSVVPEPSALLLLGMGALGFLACRQRRQRR